MPKILCMTIGLLLVTLGCATAEIYRCRTAAGDLVMTDNEAALPADCDQVKETTGGGSFNTVPSVSVKKTKRPESQSEKKPSAAMKSVTLWKNDANELVKSYKDAVRRRYRESYGVDKRRAALEIPGLKQKKQTMIDNLPGSGLTRDQQASVSAILDDIPQE